MSVTTHSLTSTSRSNTAEVRIPYKTGVRAETLLVIMGFLRECAEQEVGCCLWRMHYFPPLNTSRACAGAGFLGVLAARCFIHSSVSVHLEGVLLG